MRIKGWLSRILLVATLAGSIGCAGRHYYDYDIGAVDSGEDFGSRARFHWDETEDDLPPAEALP